jgi:flagellar motility protein MotE (MotC chaperone)
MSFSFRRLALVALVASFAPTGFAAAEDAQKAKPATEDAQKPRPAAEDAQKPRPATEDAQKPKPAADKGAESEIARYCVAIAPSAVEARLNYQLKQLVALEARVKEETAALEKREAGAREWVTKREELMKAATDEVVAVYAKMSAEAAATQLADMDEAVATSILTKLKPQVASAILNEMDNEKAARLTTIMSGGSPEDKKS